MMRSRFVEVSSPSADDCLFCPAASGCGCRRWRANRGSRRNPAKLSEMFLAQMPRDARTAFENGLRLEQTPRRKGDFKPWAVQGDDLWEREWFVPGWLIQDRTLFRTIWRFDDSGDKERIDAVDVDDPSYFPLMEGYGEDGRVSSWRDYFTWVIQNGRDPLDELKIEDDPREARLERWVCTVRDLEKAGRTVAVELVGGKPAGAPGALRTPESLPKHVRRWFNAVRDDANGAWILMDGYRNVSEFAADVTGRPGVSTAGGVSADGSFRLAVEVEGPANGLTPRTEQVREAAVEALRALTV